MTIREIIQSQPLSEIISGIAMAIVLPILFPSHDHGGKEWFEEQKKARKDANAAEAKLAKEEAKVVELEEYKWMYEDLCK